MCLVRLPFVRLFLCWQEKHFPQIIDYQNYIKNATKKRERERERERGDRLGRATRIFLRATSYSPLNCPRTCHAYLLLLAGPSLQQSDRIDCNNAINVMNVRAGIYIQLLQCVHVCEHVCARLCLSMRVCVCACKRIYHLATLLFSLSLSLLADPTHDTLLQTTAEAHKSSGS